MKEKLSSDQIEQLAVEIRELLLSTDMWQDVAIYFNHKCFTSHDKVSGKYYYNDKEHLIIEENIEPQTYFEYVNPDHKLSMSFEGPVYDMLNYGEYPETGIKFEMIIEKYGLYYEFGNHWNLSCYYI